MTSAKSYYSLAEAADLLHCTPTDLIHMAVHEQITLLVGVPDNVRFRTYDAEADIAEFPALLEPQLLALMQSHCLKIELNGKTEQSDFRDGYLINPAGQLQKLMPSYGRPKLNHLWAFWRTYDGPFSKKIELSPERLFVVGTDLLKLLNVTPKLAKEKTSSRKQTETAFTSTLSSSEQPIRQSDGVVENVIPHTKQIVTQKAEAKSSIQSVDASITSAPPTIIRLKQIQERTGLSRSTIYDKMDAKSPRFDSTFPKRVSLGPGSVGWYEFEINSWLESRRK